MCHVKSTGVFCYCRVRLAIKHTHDTPSAPNIDGNNNNDESKVMTTYVPSRVVFFTIGIYNGQTIIGIGSSVTIL